MNLAKQPIQTRDKNPNKKTGFVQAFALLFFIFISAYAYFINSLLFWEVTLILVLLSLVFVKKFRNNFKEFRVLFGALFLTIVLTFLMNFWLSGIEEAILYTLRIFAMGIFSLEFVLSFKTSNLLIGILTLLLPLKKFSPLNYYKVALILEISLTLVLVFINSFRQLTLSLKSKGFQTDVINILKQPTVFLNCLLNLFFESVYSLTLSLDSKGVGNFIKSN